MADNPLPTRLWDAAEHLKTDAEVAAYLDAALAEGDPALVAAVLDDIARARGMTQPERSGPDSTHPLPLS